jgi:hypothetical protein
LLLLLFACVPLGYFQIKPYLTHRSPIEVRVRDSSGKPRAAVEISYREFTFAPLIPIPFGPARSIEKDGVVVTDAEGFARFGIRFDAYVLAVRQNGNKLIVHHTTTKTWNGYTTTSKTIEGAGIAQWSPALNSNQLQSTEIFLADPTASKP